jgi:prepilin-type N-terminal cleavage/methylation domain-containing protein
MMEITTSNSTRVKDASFLFGNFLRKDKFIIMTTPTLPLLHQKIFPHAKSAMPAQSISLGKNNPSRLCPDSVGAWRPLRDSSAFTLVELLAVITVIGILAGLTLGAAGAVRRHGATSQAKSEIEALRAACERYYADFGFYPSNTSANPEITWNPANYVDAGRVLYTNLLGVNRWNITATNGAKRYFEPKVAMVYTNNASQAPYFIDPWGNAYGYYSDSTNSPLIWSTANGSKSTDTNKWIISWPRL